MRIERNFTYYYYYLLLQNNNATYQYYSDTSIPTLKYNILSKDKLDYSTNSVRKFWEGKNLTYK